MKTNPLMALGMVTAMLGAEIPAQTLQTAVAQNENQSILVLISRPTDIGTNKDQKKSLWLAALLDAATRFRFDFLTCLRTVDMSGINRYVPAALEAGATIDYTNVISDQKPTHIVNQKFTFSEKTGTLHWYIQAIDLMNGSVVSSFETEAPFDYLPHTADSLFRKTVIALTGKKLSHDEMRFFRSPLLCIDSRNNRTLGNLLLDDCYNTRIPPRSMGDKYAELLKIEKQPIMVMWYCGLASARNSEVSRAQEMYRALFPLLPKKERCGLAIAQVNVIKGDAQMAKYHLSSMVSENKKPLREVYATLGDAYLLSKDTTDALAYYEKERDLYGTGPALLGKTAPLYFAKNQFGRAKTEYETLFRQDTSNADAAFALAVIALKTKRLQDADAYLAVASVPDKGAPELWEQLGDAYVSAGDRAKAISAYEKVVAREKKASNALLKLADVHLAAGHDITAADCYVRLFEMDPGQNGPFLLKAARLYTALKSPDKAAESYERYFKEGFTSYEATVAFARIVYSREEWKKVIDLLKTNADSAAAKKEVLFMLANSYCHTDEYKEAVPVLITLHAMDPEDPRILELSAIANEKTGNLARAALLYETYPKYKTGKTAAQHAYHAGEIYENLGRTQDAIARYKANTGLFPQDRRNYERLTVLFMTTGAWADLRQILAPAVNRIKAIPVMYKALAQAYTALGDRQRAVAMYQAYLDREPKDDEAWLELGAVFFEQKRYSRSIKPLTYATKKRGKDFRCHSMLGFAYLRLKRYRDALDALEKAHDINPKDIPTLERIAKCQRSLKQRKDLIATLKEWAELSPGRYDVSVEVSGLLLARKDYDGAIRYAKEALRNKPGDPTARRIIYRATKKKK
jgi:tetratricopeptide (TPR) repeat protein